MTRKIKNAARKASAAKQTNAETANDNGRKTVRPEHLALKFHFATVSGGRKLPEGTKVEVLHVGVNRYGKEYALTVQNAGQERPDYIDPKFLTVGAKLPAARIAKIEAEREAASEETLIVPGIVAQERDKAVLLDYSGWFKPVWFPKTMITYVGDHTDGTRKLYEVPAWKVRKDRGADSYEALAALQDALTEMVS